MNPQAYAPQQVPPMAQVAQEVRFYKSSLIGFRSAAGRLEGESKRMLAQGWKIRSIAFVGLNFFFQRVVCCVYEK